jgi:hypothetical protein
MPPTRITVSLVPAAEESLRQAARQTGLSKTDVVNRALQLYEFINIELSTGADVIVRRGNSEYLIKLL